MACTGKSRRLTLSSSMGPRRTSSFARERKDRSQELPYFHELFGVFKDERRARSVAAIQDGLSEHRLAVPRAARRSISRGDSAAESASREVPTDSLDADRQFRHRGDQRRSDALDVRSTLKIRALWSHARHAGRRRGGLDQIRLVQVMVFGPCGWTNRVGGLRQMECHRPGQRSGGDDCRSPRRAWHRNLFACWCFRTRAFTSAWCKSFWRCRTNRALDVQLAVSRDGVRFTRDRGTIAARQGARPTRTAFLPNGPVGSWDRFNQSLANNPPIAVGDELRFYYGGRTYRHAPYKGKRHQRQGRLHRTGNDSSAIASSRSKRRSTAARS